MGEQVKNVQTRLFLLEDGAGPATVPDYLGNRVRAQAFSSSSGDRTPIREPSGSQYGLFVVIDSITGEPDLPSLAIQARYQFTKDEFLRLQAKGCAIDLQVHMGKCQDPRDFNGGWNKVLVAEGAQITGITSDDLGALEQGDEAIVNVAIDTTALRLYEIKQLSFAELAASQVTNEIVDVTICDSPNCGVCGSPSDGCQKVFAIQLRNTGSPGVPAELIASEDGGATIIESNIDSLPVNQDPTAIACVGTHLVVVSNGDCAIHHAPIADVLDATDSWTRNASGLTCAAGAPNDIFSLGATFTWVVGDGGHIYFYDDITSEATVQDAGVATTQDLEAIHGFDELNLVAVGASNAVVHTENGGTTWASVTGPAVGVVLNAVVMHTKEVWLVGTAGGRLFYTRDAGDNWTEISFPGSGTGVVRDLQFATSTVGYMAHDTAAGVGRILRTIDGGHSWYVLPEGTGTLPSNSRIDAIAPCSANVDVVYAGGLKSGTDGVLLKGA